MRGAGTKAQVFIILVGTTATSPKRILENSPNNFERGATDTFTIDTVDLGDIAKVTIGHDNSGFGPDWFCENISIEYEATGKEWHFPCGRWFSDSQDDKLLIRDITQSDKPAKGTMY